MIIIIIIIVCTLLGLMILAQVIIYSLKNKHEFLKRIMPKHKWHIQRLHENYTKKEEQLKGVPKMRNPPSPPTKD